MPASGARTSAGVAADASTPKLGLVAADAGVDVEAAVIQAAA